MKQAPRGMAVLLAAMTAIGPFSIDTYLPAFPAMATGLGATPISRIRSGQCDIEGDLRSPLLRIQRCK